MKKKCFLILFFVNLIMNAQSINWEWAKSFGSNNLDKSNSLAVDSNSNTYTIGRFYGSSITFEGSQSINNNGQSDVFLTKHDASGNLVWAKVIGGLSNDYGFGVTTDQNDNVLVTGCYLSQTLTIGSTTLAGTNNTRTFVAKYNSSGDLIWAKKFNDFSQGNSITTDSNGNVFVIGNFSGTNVAFENIVLTSNGSTDIFIAKLDSNGNMIFCKSFGGSGEESGNFIKVNSLGNIFVTGSFSSASVSFDSVTVNKFGSGQLGDFFLTKLDSSGTTLWAKGAGGYGNNWDIGYGITTDDSDNAYVISEFCSAAINVGGYQLSNSFAGNNNTFIAKYTSNGTVSWVKNLALSQNGGFCITSDNDGNIYVASNFGGQINLDSATINFNGGYDIFIVKYNNLGSFQWATSVGGPTWDYAYGIDLNSSNDLFITGSVVDDNTAFGNTILNNSLTKHMYVAKLTQSNLSNEPFLLNNLGIQLVPNPAHNEINIKGINSKSLIKIHNEQGKIVVDQEAITDLRLDIKNLQKGIYFISIQSEKNIEIRKLIIE